MSTRDLRHLFCLANRRKRKRTNALRREREALKKLQRAHSALLIENDRLGDRFRAYVATHPEGTPR